MKIREDHHQSLFSMNKQDKLSEVEELNHVYIENLHGSTVKVRTFEIQQDQIVPQ